MNSSMDEHLRVRLSRGQREGLERLIIQRGRNETVSDLVRELISTALGVPEGTAHSAFNQDVQQILENLSRETNRPPDQVTADCISGVWGLVESERSPLIVEEVKLRRRYRSESSSPILAAARELTPRTL
jgi:hypothetical protein